MWSVRGRPSPSESNQIFVTANLRGKPAGGPDAARRIGIDRPPNWGAVDREKAVRMKVAVFLDVDKTLTKDYIQSGYAKALGCENEYRAIESKFQTGEIDSEQFGVELCKLFASRRFTHGTAIDKFDCVELQSWADRLLDAPIDRYLISSGPSYYIDELASRHNIPPDHVIRSEYYFDSKTGYISHCTAVDEHQKADFVQKNVAKHDITVGIGDNQTFDGPFVSHCTIQVLTTLSGSTLYAQSFRPVISLVEKLKTIKENEAQLPIDEERHVTLLETIKTSTLSDYLTIGGFLAALFTAGYGVCTLVDYIRSSTH
jgi:phosphoserine phosphatase